MQQYFVGKFNCQMGKSIPTNHQYMDYIPMTLHLLSHVILDMFWIQVGVDLEIQLTGYPQDIGVFILRNAGLVMKFTLCFNLLTLIR